MRFAVLSIILGCMFVAFLLTAPFWYAIGAIIVGSHP
jgi:hypothetical protein